MRPHPANSNLKKAGTIVSEIDRLLQLKYGAPNKQKRTDPLDVLIRTILSQNTSDTNSDRAFSELRKRFSDWNEVKLAPLHHLENAIRIGGLAKTKAQRIRSILTHIYETHGKLSLKCLYEMQPEEASSVLAAFKGVGPKTINCVLLFGCGMDVFPVDTHILRISKRLGLLPENTNLEAAHVYWAQILPEGLAYSLHINLIAHGRLTCEARKPQCAVCILNHLCQYALRPKSDPTNIS